jgi:hypothetical protein
MKIAVINFSGNVGKSTVARYLLLPRIPGAELIAIESLNADEGQVQALRGRQFGELQEYQQTVSCVVIDIGASNVEDLMGQMQRYRGSHEDFDAFVVPTVPALKQQPIARVNRNGKLGANEIYGRTKGTKTDLATLATDPTDYKAMIAQAKGTIDN